MMYKHETEATKKAEALLDEFTDYLKKNGDSIKTIVSFIEMLNSRCLLMLTLEDGELSDDEKERILTFYFFLLLSYDNEIIKEIGSYWADGPLLFGLANTIIEEEEQKIAESYPDNEEIYNTEIEQEDSQNIYFS